MAEKSRLKVEGRPRDELDRPPIKPPAVGAGDALKGCVMDRSTADPALQARAPTPEDLTDLLGAWQDGDPEAADRLFTAIYPELRKIAASGLRRSRDLTCQPTELVHEAYLKMERGQRLSWRDRTRFFGFASQLIRQILVDRCRRRGARKRQAEFTAFDPDWLAKPAAEPQLLALDEALERLAAEHAEAARIVELRFFGGLSIPEAAAFLDLGTATVSRRWQIARAWLHRELSSSSGSAGP